MNARQLIGLVLALLMATLTIGCAGYQIGARTLFRPDIRTVSVPVFQSDSYRRYLGERLTEAVVKEIESRTPYKVVQSPAADSVLTGRLLTDYKRVLSEDRNDAPRNLEVALRVEVSWTDRRGQDLTPAGALLFADNANFIPEAGQSITTAQQAAIDRLAQQIVSRMELTW